MDDREAFQKFYQQISWADECQEIELGDRVVCQTSISLIVASHSDFQTILFNAVLVSSLAAELNVEPMLLIWGETTKEAVEQICFTLAKLKIAMDWLDAKNKVYYTGFLTSALDGIDWGRSISAITRDGMKAEPVWQWDKD